LFAVHWCHVLTLDSVRRLPPGGGVTPMTRSGPTMYQTNHTLLCRLLRKILADGVQAGRGAAGGIGSVRFRASATLYALLLAYLLDQQDPYRSCRRPDAVLAYRRHCWVHGQARYWLRQPEWLLHFRIADSGDWPPSAGAAPDQESSSHPADPDDTNTLSRIEPDVIDPLTQPSQTPAAPPQSSHRSAGAGWSDPDHGGAGDVPLMASGLAVAHPRTHEHPPSGGSLLFTGGVTW
jgi:hypothetical protein